ncbi:MULTISPECIES: sporulation histidine kinase inhibitor Sda [unclassified Paenibacillus]
MSNEDLIVVYLDAKNLTLDVDFINLLLVEIKKRHLVPV